MASTYRRSRPAASRFVDVTDLEPGMVVRHHGDERKVLGVEPSPDRYHWRVRLDGVRQTVIVPPCARFTFAPPKESSTS